MTQTNQDLLSQSNEIRDMSRDSQASYIHLKKSHHALYRSNWVHDQLPFDPIDNPHILNLENDQDISTSLPPTTFGSIKSHKEKHEAVWKDLETFKLIDDDDGYVKDTGYDNLLKKLEKVHGLDIDTFEHSHDEPSPEPSFLNNSSFANTSSSSLPSIEITATPDSRTRNGQRNAQNFQAPNFQTPISRIMR
jgi:hypothetical protein